MLIEKIASLVVKLEIMTRILLFLINFDLSKTYLRRPENYPENLLIAVNAASNHFNYFRTFCVK